MERTLYYENHRGLTEPGIPAISREFRIGKEEEVRLHWHEGVEVIHVLEGSCKIQRNFHLTSIYPGDIVIVSAGALHQLFGQQEDVRYEYMILERELWEELAIPMDADQFTEECIQDEELGWMLGEFVRLSEIKGAYVQIQQKGLLHLITGRLLERCLVRKGENQEDKRIPAIRKAILYMEFHYREHFSTEELAEEAGYSKYHFCRCFKAMTGMTPVEYGNRLRCERVKKMLSTSCTIEQAALSCGFSNMAYFYRTYKKYMGHLPSADTPENMRER